MSEVTGTNWRSYRNSREFQPRRLAKRTLIPRFGPSKWFAPPARDDLNRNADAPQAIGDGLTEIQPAFAPAIARLGRAGGAEYVHSLGFEHFLDAIDMIAVAHYDARLQVHAAHD